MAAAGREIYIMQIFVAMYWSEAEWQDHTGRVTGDTDLIRVAYKCNNSLHGGLADEQKPCEAMITLCTTQGH